MESDQDLEEFCKALPKIELHAHLNGCVRLSTLRELALANGLSDAPIVTVASTNPPLQSIPTSTSKTLTAGLSPYFDFFNLLHEITTTLDVIRRITRECIEDFAADNVKYLEIRTTPKSRPEHGISKLSYIEAVLQGIEDYYEKLPTNDIVNSMNDKNINVKLLLSVDRRENAAAAMETAELAISLARTHPFGGYIVGVELGGNPAVGKWEDWEPAMRAVRAAGLNVALHCAEIWNEEESLAMVEWGPGRLGHMVCMTEKLQQKLLESRIPVEICLSSNVMTQSVATVEEHHFRDLYSKGHPVVLCTDDPSEGIFDTMLSKEYEMAARTFGLTKGQLIDLALNAVDATFLNKEDKKALKDQMAEDIVFIILHE